MLPDRDDEYEIGPDLTDLERRLSSWRPSAIALDRDRMLYDAGRASVMAGARPWRLATAAMMLVAVGLGGLLVRQESRLARDWALLAQERALRIRLDRLLAERSAPAPPIEPAPEPIEAPNPNSYGVLTARLAQGRDIADSAEVAIEPAPQQPASDPPGGGWHPTPLRPQDIRRVLDL